MIEPESRSSRNSHNSLLWSRPQLEGCQHLFLSCLRFDVNNLENTCSIENTITEPDALASFSFFPNNTPPTTTRSQRLKRNNNKIQKSFLSLNLPRQTISIEAREIRTGKLVLRKRRVY